MGILAGVEHEDGNAGPTVDRAVVVELRDSFKDDPEALSEIVALFVDGTGDRLRLAGEAVNTGDSAALQAAAHTMRGMSGIVGAHRLGMLAENLEDVAMAREFGHASELLGELKVELARVRAVLAESLPPGCLR